MKKRINLKYLLYIDIAILLIFIFYKGYLLIFETDFQSFNINNIKQLNKIESNEEFSFAVLGNIKNSIDIFDTRIVKKINSDKDIDFVVSTGNAVIDAAEDKYRILNESLKKINVPTIIGVGENEVSDFGEMNFYKHYGPFYFSYNLDDAYFIFLDTSGKTSEEWQKQWLIKELKIADKYKYKFVFMNKPPFKVTDEALIETEDKYIKHKEYANFLTKTFSEHKVNAAFASGAQIYEERRIEGVDYYISGGAGGTLILNNKESFYHYLKVSVNKDGIKYSVVKQKTPSNFIVYRVAQNIWFYIHSIFYINFINFILVLCVLAFIAILIRNKVTKEVDYYRDFNELPEEILGKDKLNIAMFTNNYLPFIGGVPISIKRLSKGLRKRGHEVYIFAPEYPGKSYKEDKNIIRCKLFNYYKGKNFNFAIVNIFSPQIEKDFKGLNIDVIHVHHPFWMGSKGLSLGKKYKLPVVLTYHTRLEMYAHFLPLFKTTFKNVVSHYMIRKFSQKCNAIFAPTITAKEYLENVGVSRHKEVLPTGIDFDNYNHIKEEDIEEINKKYRVENEILLCSVSRLSEEKNIYFLLQGLKYIKDNCNINFKCLIIGDGPEKENLLKTVEKYKLNEYVKFIGSVAPEEIPKYYMACDLFVFASKSETQGMVLLEAMAGKCPVVAVRSSGIEDVIDNGYNGFKTKEELELWGEKVIYFMENSYKLKEMSCNAYDFSNKYSLDQMAKKAEGVYLKAIVENQSRINNNMNKSGADKDKNS